jgi:serine/threonine protein phosphatase 1
LRRETIFLKGNHEAILLEVLKHPETIQTWNRFGGSSTLASYGLTPSLKSDHARQVELAMAFADVIPRDHLQFLEQLKSAFSFGDFLFVHAGLRPGIPLELQKEEDMLWIREEFLDSDEDFGKFVVHGHTPVREPDVRNNRINIDTGCYATGKLTVLRIERDRLSVA